MNLGLCMRYWHLRCCLGGVSGRGWMRGTHYQSLDEAKSRAKYTYADADDREQLCPGCACILHAHAAGELFSRSSSDPRSGRSHLILEIV